MNLYATPYWQRVFLPPLICCSFIHIVFTIFFILQLPDLGKPQIEGVTGLLNQVIQIVTQEKSDAVGQVLSLSPMSSPTTIRKFKINVENRKVS